MIAPIKFEQNVCQLVQKIISIKRKILKEEDLLLQQWQTSFFLF